MSEKRDVGCICGTSAFPAFHYPPCKALPQGAIVSGKLEWGAIVSGKLECPHLEYTRVRKMYCDECIAAAEERGRRAGIEEAAKWMRKPDAAQMLFTLEQTGFLAPRDSGKVHVNVSNMTDGDQEAFGGDSGKDEENRDVLDVEREP